MKDKLPREDWPRERLLKQGAEQLKTTELLAILLRTGRQGENVVDLAARVYKTYGESLDRLANASPSEINDLTSMGINKAITLKAALELARRLSSPGLPVEDKAATGAGRLPPKVLTSTDVFHRFRNRFLVEKQECFHVLLLDTKHRVMRDVLVSKGILNQALVHPRESFKEALRDSAKAVIFVHNHPSGDPEPSQSDDKLTARLVKVGDLLGIPVLDHIIIGRDHHYSYRDCLRLNTVKE